jgi:hypothetical protein
VLTDPDKEIKTPYIWIPVTYLPDGVTENNKLKQIDTNNCSVIETYDVISTPSRTYVVPAGDVWVASLTGTDISKLSPLHGTALAGGSCGDNFCGVDETIYYCPEDCKGNRCGAVGGEDCRKYEVVGTFSPADIGGVKGMTGLKDITSAISNNIWTGDFGDGDVSGLDDGIKIDPDVMTGGCPFGAAADYFNRVWVSNPCIPSLQCINASDMTFTNADPIVLPYSIAIDDDSRVYVTYHDHGTVRRYDPAPGACPGALAPAVIYDTFMHFGTMGVAVDQKGYVWTANSHDNELYTFINSTTWYNVHPGTEDLSGVAIDFDGYGWVVSFDAGIAYKYEFDDVLNLHNLQCQTPYLEGKPDGYSDMTGLRKTEKTFTADNGLSYATISSTGTFEVCGAGVNDCSGVSSCGTINDILSACVPDEFGKCEIPLEVFSYQAGNYTLKNLEIIYKIPIPITTGGLVPCGRDWDNPDTLLWDETDPCQLCHLIIFASVLINFLMGLIIPISILVLIIAGLIYIKTSGDVSLITAAKQNVDKILYGFTIVFVAWVIVNVIMILFGFNDPLGDGSWQIFSCNL